MEVCMIKVYRVESDPDTYQSLETTNPNEQQIFTLVNILNCLNCLDVDKSSWHYKLKTTLPPLRYAFYPERFRGSPGLFKIPETCRREVLIWIDTELSKDDDFIDRYNYAQLQ